MALADFLPPCELTDGEQLGVALALLREVTALLKTPEIKRQIKTLVPPLLSAGCLLQHQVEKLLKPLPESAVGRRKSRELVANLERRRVEFASSAIGYAPEFSWTWTPDSGSGPERSKE
jgi:hypothetical protein